MSKRIPCLAPASGNRYFRVYSGCCAALSFSACHWRARSRAFTNSSAPSSQATRGRRYLNLRCFFLPSRCCSLIFHFSVLPRKFSPSHNSQTLYRFTSQDLNSCISSYFINSFIFIVVISLRRFARLASGPIKHDRDPRPSLVYFSPFAPDPSRQLWFLCFAVGPLPSPTISTSHLSFYLPRPNSCNFVQRRGN